MFVIFFPSSFSSVLNVLFIVFQLIKDELQVLQLEYTSLDDKFKKTQVENRELVWHNLHHLPEQFWTNRSLNFVIHSIIHHFLYFIIFLFHLFIYSPIYIYIHPFIHSFIYLLTVSFFQSFKFNYLVICSLFYQVERWMIQKAKDADKVNMENELQVR